MKLKSEAILTGMLLIAPIALAATLEGTTVTSTEPLEVHLSGTAYLSVNPKARLLAGQHPAGFTIAEWQAGVTAGTVAYRLTPELVEQAEPAQPSVGRLPAIANPAQSIHVVLVSSECANARVSDAWMVCPEGVSEANGVVNLWQSQQVLAGTYRVGIDTVVWGF